MIHVFGGGTVNFVRNHLALCAPAYGRTARTLCLQLRAQGVPSTAVQIELTRMAQSDSAMETNADVSRRLDEVLANPATRIIVFNVALCDYEGAIGDVPSGKYASRLSSREGALTMTLTPADKLLARIRAQRPDILLVGFKTTAGGTQSMQLALAHRQIEETHAQWVLANDVVTRSNMLMCANPEGEPDFHFFPDRSAALVHLAQRLKAAYWAPRSLR